MNFQQNNLKSATSPYLKQHEKNPVWWQIWSDEVLNYAQKVNKPLLISIGYSACHWCHVMEHESFENDEVAALMNEHFVCIKVDREERPDLDTIYMNVAQLIHQSGGWPLNVFTMPDGRPFYGGTYFPKLQWIELLENINFLYHHQKDKTLDYVNSLADGLNKMEIIPLKNKFNFPQSKIDETFNFWKQQFDDEWGGFNRAPKFMLPNAWEAILRYGFQTENEDLLIQTKITLDEKKNFDCWIENGFRFPPMQRTSEIQQPFYLRGLDLPTVKLVSCYSIGYQGIIELRWPQRLLLEQKDGYYKIIVDD